MRTCLFLLFGWLILLPVAADPVDSLLASASLSGPRAEAQYLCDMADSLMYSRPNLSRAWARGALLRAEKLADMSLILEAKYILGQAHFHLRQVDSSAFWLRNLMVAAPDSMKSQASLLLGRSFVEQDQYDSAAHYLDQAQSLAAVSAQLKIQAEALYRMGVMYDLKGDYELAIQSLLQARPLFEQMESSKALAYCLNSLGRVNQNVKKSDEAADYYQQAYELFLQEGDLVNQAMTLNNLGSLLLYQNPDQARDYVEKAYAVNQQTEDLFQRAAILTNLAALAWKAGKPEEALQHDLEVLAIHETRNDLDKQAMALNNVAYCYRDLKRYREAQRYAEASLKLAREIQARARARSALINLSTIHERQGDYRQGYAYARAYMDLNDTLTRESNRRMISELQTRYETEKQKQEIELLTQKEALQSSLIAQGKLQIEQRNLWLGFLGLGLLLAALIAWVFWQRSSIAQKERRLAEQEVVQLEQQRQLDALSAMLEGQETERSRIARDLHDSLGGLLASLKLQFAQLSKQAPKKEATETERLLDQTSEEVRRIAHNMAPSLLQRFGLLAVLEQHCEAVAQAVGLDLSFQALRVEEDRLSSAQQTMLYRIVQELLQNIVKHAGASQVLVQLAQHEERLEITVEDDGKGFEPEAQTPGIGLQNIQSRVEFLKGELAFHSQPGAGTSVEISVPF